MGHMKRAVCVVATILCWLSWPPAASAQSTRPDDGLRPRVFAGAALALTSTDLDARMRLAADTPARAWFVEAGFPLRGRFGVGLEFGGPSDATGETRGISFDSRGRQRERLLIGLGRVCVAGSSRWGVDVVGGAGALFQHHESLEAFCGTCTDFRRTIVDHDAPAFVVGADVPVRVAGPLWLGAVVRYHVLARGSHQTNAPVLFVPWQDEWKSSRRLAVGLDFRIGR
jgi:hypothetical protein